MNPASALSRFLSATVIAFLMIAALNGLLSPLWERLSDRNALLDRTERLETRLLAEAAPTRSVFDIEPALVRTGTPATLANRLQTAMQQDASTTGLSIRRVQPMDSEELGGVGVLLIVEMQASGDLLALETFVERLARREPQLIVRSLDIRARGTRRPDDQLDVTLQAALLWSPDEEAS